MATELEIRWLNSVAQMQPRFIESEQKWAVAWENEFDREIQRFDDEASAKEFARDLRETGHDRG